MPYSVVWDPECFSQLDALLDAGIPAAALMDTVRAITEQLGHSPETAGEHLSEGLRKIDVLPLRAYFHFEQANERAVVDGITWVGAGPP